MTRFHRKWNSPIVWGAAWIPLARWMAGALVAMALVGGARPAHADDAGDVDAAGDSTLDAAPVADAGSEAEVPVDVEAAAEGDSTLAAVPDAAAEASSDEGDSALDAAPVADAGSEAEVAVEVEAAAEDAAAQDSTLEAVPDAAADASADDASKAAAADGSVDSGQVEASAVLTFPRGTGNDSYGPSCQAVGGGGWGRGWPGALAVPLVGMAWLRRRRRSGNASGR